MLYKKQIELPEGTEFGCLEFGPPFPLEKDLPLLPSSHAKEKGKPIQTLDRRTNHNLSDPYTTSASDPYT